MVYTAPSFSFIDVFTNGARALDEKRRAQQQQFMEGLGNLAKGGADAYKWQKRKDDLERMRKLEEEEAELKRQLQMLQGGADVRGSSGNFDAIVNGLDWNLMPKEYRG